MQVREGENGAHSINRDPKLVRLPMGPLTGSIPRCRLYNCELVTKNCHYCFITDRTTNCACNGQTLFFQGENIGGVCSSATYETDSRELYWCFVDQDSGCNEVKPFFDTEVYWSNDPCRQGKFRAG